MGDKFLFIREGSEDGTLIAEDGGVGTIWHNGEHWVGQCYRERLELEKIKESGLADTFEEMCGSSSNSSMFDFEDNEIILPMFLEEMADWLVSPREGEFFENLTFIDDKDFTQEEIDFKVAEFLMKNDSLKEIVT